MKLIFPTILIIISGALFFLFISPTYKEINTLKNDVSIYNTAFKDSTNLQQTRDNLISSYKSISKADKERLDKFLPNTVNNIKFILEVERLANSHNMSVKNIMFDSRDSLQSGNKANSQLVNVIPTEGEENSSYGVFPIQFTTEGSYESFVSFMKDLETNLRLVDVKKVSFSTATTKGKNNAMISDIGSREFNIEVETYWLK